VTTVEQVIADAIRSCLESPERASEAASVVVGALCSAGFVVVPAPSSYAVSEGLCWSSDLSNPSGVGVLSDEVKVEKTYDEGELVYYIDDRGGLAVVLWFVPFIGGVSWSAPGRIVHRQPLTAEETKLSLAELTAKYPPPVLVSADVAVGDGVGICQ
jgi:hypothetical protein